MCLPGAAALALAMLAVKPCAVAGGLAGKPFVYDAKEVQLPDVLRDFAGSESIPIVIADGVTGTVNAKFSMTPRAFMDLISRSFGLIWYYDGVAIYVYPSSQIQSRLFKLSGTSAGDARTKLTNFGLLDERYPVRFVPVEDGTLAFAAGPPRHIELLEALISALHDTDSAPSPQVTRSFQLMNAPVVDRTILGVKVPGVLSALLDLYGGGQARPAARDLASTTNGTAPVDSMSTLLVGDPQDRTSRDGALLNATRSLASPSAQALTPNRPAAAAEIYKPTKARPAPQAPAVTFAADESTNLLIVRAPADQMETIASLIAKLDTPAEMFEVQASIIDVSSDEMASLGFDWQFSRNASQIQISPTGTATSTSSSVPQGDGFNITTLLSSGGKELLSRIRALEGHGQARVVSQPKILVAGNHTALLSDTRTASVRVAGNQDAKLYSIETGTQLQVTPRLVTRASGAGIGMEIAIQDGGFSSDTVDNVPIADRSSISTMVTLEEGQALLVGGISVDSTSSGRSGIPWLSNVPLLGALFRVDASQSSHRQRLFLITPRRIRIDAAHGATAAPAQDSASSVACGC